MNKEEIIKTVSAANSTVLSFPDRGADWGDSRYRGNCSGYIHAFLIWRYGIKKLAELFAGSGTGYDVAKDMGIQYVGADLNPVPVRPGMLSVNALTDEVPDEFRDAGMVFMHPPYGKEIGIPYAGSMYPDRDGKLSESDLGQMPWDKFIPALNHIIMKYYSAMAPGAYMAVLMGDIRRKGHFYSMFSDIVKPGNLEQVFIKMQHNTVSGRKTYTNNNFSPIEHETLMVIRKALEMFVFECNLPKKYKGDLRRTQNATWTDLVSAALRNLGGKAKLSDIYAELSGCEKAKSNNFPQEKIRQTLAGHPKLFARTEPGVYMAVA